MKNCTYMLCFNVLGMHSFFSFMIHVPILFSNKLLILIISCN